MSVARSSLGVPTHHDAVVKYRDCHTSACLAIQAGIMMRGSRRLCGLAQQDTERRFCTCVCRYWVVTRLVTGRVRAHSCVREPCVRRLLAAWGVTVCRIILPFARGCRVGLWFGCVRATLLPAVGTCVVLSFGAMPLRCCFLHVTLKGAVHHPQCCCAPGK